MRTIIFFICFIGVVLLVSGCVNNGSSQPTTQPNIIAPGDHENKTVTLYGNVTVNGEIPGAEVEDMMNYFGCDTLAIGQILFLETRDNSTNTFEVVNTFIHPNGSYEIQVNAGDAYPVGVYFFNYDNDRKNYDLPFKKISVSTTTRYDIDLKDDTPKNINSTVTPTPPPTYYLSGRVYDADHKAITNAKVTIYNKVINGYYDYAPENPLATQFTYASNVGGRYLNGTYQFSGLTPGPYVITAEKDGIMDYQTVQVQSGWNDADITIKGYKG